MCAPLLVAASAAHAAGALTPEVQVMGAANLNERSGAIAPAIVADPRDPGRLLATSTSTFSGRTLSVVRSMDGGASWTAGPPPQYPTDTVPGLPVAFSAGEASLAWGVLADQTRRVFFAEPARATPTTLTCDDDTSGIWATFSTNGGGTWANMQPVQRPGEDGQSLLRVPRLTYDDANHRLVLAYERVRYASTDCSGSPVDTEIWIAWSNDDGLSWETPRLVAPHASEPSIAVLPGGRVVVAYWDASLGAVATMSCNPVAPMSCSGPVAVDISVVDPGQVAGVEAHPQPDVAVGRDIAGSSRVVVAWTSRVGGVAQIRTASSLDGGAHYSPPAVAVPGTDDQFDPRLVAAQGTTFGRVDLAFMQDAANNTALARTTSSDTPPAGGGETWSTAVRVQTDASHLAGTATSSPQGWLALATTPSNGPPSALRVAWIDSNTGLSNDPSDVHGVSLLHGSLAPTLASSGQLKLPANADSTIVLNGADGDGDPLHYSILSPPAHGTASVPNPVRPAISYTPLPGYIGADAIVAQVTDGVSTVAATLSLQIGNSPPTISCGTLATPENTVLRIDLASCISDPNGDSFVVQASGAQHGSVSSDGSTFTPEANYHGQAGFSIRATDSGGAYSDRALTVVVQDSSVVRIEIAKPAADQRIVAVGQPVAFRATVNDDPGGKTHPVTWTFDDRPDKKYKGPLVTRVFSKPGRRVATARVEGLLPQQVGVIVALPPLQLLSIKVTPTSVSAKVRANVAGTVKLRLGGLPQVSRKVKGGKTVSTTFAVGGRPHLRTMMLRAQLAPQKKPPLPNPKLMRALVLPLR